MHTNKIEAEERILSGVIRCFLNLNDLMSRMVPPSYFSAYRKYIKET